MNHPTRVKFPIDLQKNVLRMAFQKNAAFPHDLGPAFDYRDHDLIDNEGYGFDVQALDHLHQQRRMSSMFEISGVEGEVGNHESVLLVRPRNRLSDQKPPGIAAIGVSEAKRVR